MAEKKEVSSLFLRHLAKELDKELSGGFFDKAQQLGPQEFRVSFRTKNGRKDFIIVFPGLAFLSSKRLQAPQQPGNLAMKLRKELRNTRVESVRQHGLDRILIINFEEHALVIELFSHGNLVLTKNGRIIAAFRSEEWKDRKIRPGQEYKFPESRVPDSTTPEFLKLLQEEGERVLARALGKQTAILVLSAEGIPPGEKHYTEEEAEKIQERVKWAFETDPKPCIQAGVLTPVEFPNTPVEKTFSSPSSAIEQAFPYKLEKQDEVKSKRERIIERQKAAVEEYQKKAAEEKAKADLIMQNAHIVQEAINAFKKKDFKALEELGAKITNDGKIELEL